MRSNRQKNSYTQKGRDTQRIAKFPRYLPLSEYVYKPIDRFRKTVLSLEDRRTYQPSNVIRSAASFAGRHSARIIPTSLRRAAKFAHGSAVNLPDLLQGHVPERLSFFKPSNIPICLRRKIRREVLHAFRIAGRSGIGPPRYNEYSHISCRGA